MKSMRKKKKKISTLKSIYYNPRHPHSFGGAAPFKAYKNIKTWLSGQTAYTLHKPIRKTFPTRRYRVSGIDHLWQADLLEMIPYAKINKGYKYILTIIDVFSRYAWALPLKNKSAAEITHALEQLFNIRTPRHIQTDQGKEFYNSSVSALCKKHKIKHYSVYSQYKAALVERFNGTLRSRLNRYFTFKGNKVWFDTLDDIVYAYNHRKHRGIFNMRPIDINKLNEMQLWKMQENIKMPNSLIKFSLLDYCRISRVRGPFLKNFDQNWSEEVFRIVGIDRSANPIMYILEDLNNEIVQGKFYSAELQKISKPNTYRIEKILQTKGKGAYKQYLIKWVGYNSNFNSWIKASSIEK